MTFLAVLAVYILLHWRRYSTVIQQDQWFFNLVAAFGRVKALVGTEGAVLAASIAAPLLIVLIVLLIARSIWPGLELLVAILVLLYSAGRGRFKAVIVAYLDALREGNWQQAAAAAQRFGCTDVDAALANPSQEDWQALHHKFLYSASYLGFERVFAVFFWFVVLGPIGALTYRLSSLYASGDISLQESKQGEGEEGESGAEHRAETGSEDQTTEGQTSEAALARRWLWLLEWPAVRALGISFAMTGNFMGCIHCWRHKLWDAQVSSRDFIGNCLKGALAIDESQAVSEQVEERQLRWLQSLLSRTLIFWMSLLAIVTILI